MSVFGTAVESAAWRTKPTWAVIATEDKAFDLAMVRHMANRMGADITEVAASHAVFMTQPQVVADTIHDAAQGVKVAIRVMRCSRPDASSCVRPLIGSYPQRMPGMWVLLRQDAGDVELLPISIVDVRKKEGPRFPRVLTTARDQDEVYAWIGVPPGDLGAAVDTMRAASPARRTTARAR
jgi:hypothetical protein